MKRLQLAQVSAVSARVLPNRFDLIAFLLIYGVIVLVVRGSHDMHASLTAMESTPLSLKPVHLPGYALNTVMRMMIAMCFSLLFTFTYAPLAAKSRRAGMILIPMLDILQSVPVLGFISFTVMFFIALFPGSQMGVECASIFAIFTSQAWNMTFSFYQSLRTLPSDLEEVSRSYRFTGWQRFWRLEVPFAMPGLIWNMMMSMSGGWFFVVASEAITVGDKTFTLPGVGSYVAMAIEHRDGSAIVWAIATMFIVILIYDQLLFRPLVAWSEKFRFENTESEQVSRSWVLTLIQRARVLQMLMEPVSFFCRQLLLIRPPARPLRKRLQVSSRTNDIMWTITLLVTTLYGGVTLASYLINNISFDETLYAIHLGLLTLTRVVILIALATVVWVPIGVWIGSRPGAAEKIQPLVQFLAAFPTNLVFPVTVIFITHYSLDPDIWLSPLIILGTQWYILFNVIAGASAFPNDLKDIARNFHLRGLTWWTKVMLPGIFPYYITGAITASGGSWNASIVAEMVSWGSTTLEARGIGSYIAEATAHGDYPRIVLGITVMSVMVLLFNRLFWRKLYRFAEERLRIN